MFLSKIASMFATPLAVTSDEIQPWMIAAIAAGALLALILIIVAARRSRRNKGEELREAMVAAKEEAAERMDAAADPVASWEGLPPEGGSAATRGDVFGAAGKKGQGKHSK